MRLPNVLAHAEAFPAMWTAPAAASSRGYLNSASAGLPSAPVLEAVLAYLRREAELGALDAAAEAAPRLEAAYDAAARLIGARPDEVAFVESGNRGLQALLAAVPLAPGDRVLVARAEWGGSLAMLSGLDGVSVEPMPTDGRGVLDLDAVRAMVDGRVRLILLTWCPATNGLVNPAAEVGALAAEVGATFILDACQAVGQLPVDVGTLGCHGLVASGRKWLRGPRGTALLYASRDFLARTRPAMPDQFGAPWSAGVWRPRADARRFETGEAFMAGRLGLGVAIEGALTVGVDRLQARISALAGRLREGLAALPGVVVHDTGPALSGIVTFGVAGVSAAAVRDGLAARGISVGSRGAGYAPFDMAARGLTEVARASPHVFNDEAELDAAIAAVAALRDAGRSAAG